MAGKRIVVLGMMSKTPVAGVVWQTVHYLVGLKKLGYDVWYVESHGCTPRWFMRTEQDNGWREAASFIDWTTRRFDLADRWALQARHDGEECFGLSALQLRELYASADLIINLHGGTEPLPEHSESGRLIYLETDPVEVQIELNHGRPQTTEFLSPHRDFFTFGENYGKPGCTLPVSEQFRFKPTRQPVVMNFWAGHG